MRLIDADELKKKIEEEVLNLEKNNTFISTYMHSALLWVISLINRATTIESESVRHGEWSYDFRYRGMKFANAMLRCSECGNGSFIREGEMPKFCQHCGAKMNKKSPENHKKYQEEETNKKAFK